MQSDCYCKCFGMVPMEIRKRQKGEVMRQKGKDRRAREEDKVKRNGLSRRGRDVMWLQKRGQ